jgi:hypothetical protein
VSLFQRTLILPRLNFFLENRCYLFVLFVYFCGKSAFLLTFTDTSFDIVKHTGAVCSKLCHFKDKHVTSQSEQREL